MPCYACYESPLGHIQIGHENGYILSIKLGSDPGTLHCPSPVSDLAATQLLEYLDGKRTAFELPISPLGTAFQLSVWKALLDIPYGQTRSYQQIAAAIGNPKACRAVGMACNRNPIWVVIPCHRVIGTNRELTGYAGGLELKRKLLEMEK